MYGMEAGPERLAWRGSDLPGARNRKEGERNHMGAGQPAPRMVGGGVSAHELGDSKCVPPLTERQFLQPRSTAPSHRNSEDSLGQCL